MYHLKISEIEQKCPKKRYFGPKSPQNEGIWSIFCPKWALFAQKWMKKDDVRSIKIDVISIILEKKDPIWEKKDLFSSKNCP